MSLSVASILALLLEYRYLILFPAVVAEGPIITIIVGFLISLGYFNWLLAYCIIVMADLTGDALHYLVGRLIFHPIGNKIFNFLKINKNQMGKVERLFEQHPVKTLLLGKIAHGIGGIPLIVAGVIKMDFKKFMAINIAATLPKSLALLLVGYFFGQYIDQINTYFDIGAIVTITLAAVLLISYVLITQMAKKFYSRAQNE